MRVPCFVQRRRAGLHKREDREEEEEEAGEITSLPLDVRFASGEKLF